MKKGEKTGTNAHRHRLPVNKITETGRQIVGEEGMVGEEKG